MENTLIEYDVCKRFYDNCKGDYISQRAAKAMLSRKQCRAGKYALKAGMYDKACELLKNSFHISPNLKSLVYLAKAKVMESMKRKHIA